MDSGNDKNEGRERQHDGERNLTHRPAGALGEGARLQFARCHHARQIARCGAHLPEC